MSDMDPTTTEEEIETTVRQVCEWEGDRQIRPFRVAYGDTGVTSIVMSQDIAKVLVAKRFLKIGLGQNCLRETARIGKCYRCLECGHIAQNCANANRSKTCMRCKVNGHKVAECTGIAYYWTCQEDGHRSDRRTCPVFRSLMSESRTKGSRSRTLK